MAVDVGATLETESAPVAATLSPAHLFVHGGGSPGWQRAKRIVEVTLAVILLVVLLPLFIVIAVAVKLGSPGPVFFRQERCGRDRRCFDVLKFRTMHHGASAEAHRQYIAALVAGDVESRPGLKKLTSDPRVTRVGGVLRRTSLDELPQLINVVRGEMAIVGPRPALPYELEHYEPEHFARFDVRPGITGLWQVSGRNTIGFLGMLALDCEYVRTTGPHVDTMILLRTPLAVMRKNAA
jgi:lipopolysaccharide/colanic/teichoic acid biosynthesis glycosyltransferase